MKESRQVRRKNERISRKNKSTLAQNIMVYKPSVTKSQAGVSYTNYKKSIEPKNAI